MNIKDKIINDYQRKCNQIKKLKKSLKKKSNNSLNKKELLDMLKKEINYLKKQSIDDNYEYESGFINGKIEILEDIIYNIEKR